MNNNWSKVLGGILTLGLTGMAIGFLFAMVDESHQIHDPTPVFGIVAGAVIFGVLLRGPVGAAIAKMLDGGSATADPHLTERIDQLEAHTYDESVDRQRLAELEERLDFAERLLSQREPSGMLRKSES